MASTKEHKRIVEQIDADLLVWGKRRKSYSDDVEFAVIGGEKQWEPKEWARRVADRLPRVTFNICLPVVRRVANAIASKDYAVEVVPAGTGSIADIAEIRASMIRAIQTTGGASNARATAINCQVLGGFGAYRLKIEAENDSPRIVYDRITNPLNVVPDPDAKAISFRDMTHCTIYADLPKATYKARYPKGKAASIDAEDLHTKWCENDLVRVAEFWEVVETGGMKSVKQTILDGVDILETNDQPETLHHIPIFFLVGEEWDVGGEKLYSGCIRYAKEQQQFKNFWKSEEYEYLSGKKQPPVWMEQDMVSDPEIAKTWSGGNNAAYRLYKGGPNGERPIEPTAPEIPAGYANASAEATTEFQNATGIFDVHLGRNTGESGRSKLISQEQADVSTWNYEAHVQELVEYEGEVLNELLPLFSDEAVIALAGEDGQLESREVAAIQGLREDLKGINGGTYGIRTTAGMNFKTKSEQFVSRISEIGTKNPMIAQIAAPELILAMGIPGAKDLAKQVEEVLIKQGLRQAKMDDKEAQSKMPQILEALSNLQGELQKTTQERDAIAKALQDAESGTAQKIAQAQLDAQAGLAKTQLDAQTTIEKAQIDNATRLQVAEIQARTDLKIAAMREDGQTERAVVDAITTPTATAPVVDEYKEPEIIALGGVQ